ncbi:MAG TPA: DUF455 family protein [Polyangiaceae bacterium]
MEPPASGTVERWAWEYVHSESLAVKMDPPPVPEVWEEAPPARLVTTPGRPPELQVVGKAKKTRGLAAPSGRARAFHTFFHHELQAAELMAWALLAFHETPREFRAGLVRIALDETRHMRMYAKHIEKLGFAIGHFVVRDWLWQRIPSCTTPASFVATMGLGIESANLEHTASFAARFRAAGDEEGARVQEIVGLEEIAHVRFGVRWFQTFGGTELDFETWRLALPAPLSPLLMHQKPINREARRKAGQNEDFLSELDAWQPTDSPGS